jgi:hypothetical protein
MHGGTPSSRRSSPRELDYARSRKPHPHIAARFAVKEAVAKALATGWRGFRWKDVEVGNDPLGSPPWCSTGVGAAPRAMFSCRFRTRKRRRRHGPHRKARRGSFCFSGIFRIISHHVVSFEEGRPMKQLGIKKLYYSISEVSKITGLEQYVLRYWETEFEQLKPAKNRAGNRIYTNREIKLILFIRSFSARALHDQAPSRCWRPSSRIRNGRTAELIAESAPGPSASEPRRPLADNRLRGRHDRDQEIPGGTAG